MQPYPAMLGGNSADDQWVMNCLFDHLAESTCEIRFFVFLHDNQSVDKLFVMATARRSRDESKGVRKPKTEQRTYRFNAQLWSDFEQDCARHLRNPRLVVEALVRHWLDTDDKSRGSIAEHHQNSTGGVAGDE